MKQTVKLHYDNCSLCKHHKLDMDQHVVCADWEEREAYLEISKCGVILCHMWEQIEFSEIKSPKLFTNCIICGKRLKSEKTKLVGMGKVCEKRFTTQKLNQLF